MPELAWAHVVEGLLTGRARRLRHEVANRRHCDSRVRILEAISHLSYRFAVIDLRECVVMCEGAGIEYTPVG